MISGPTPDSKSSLIIDLESAMMIDRPSFYDKNYKDRESQIFLQMAMGRFLHGNDFHITPFRYQALGDIYCMKKDNLKRDEITEMYSSAILA